MNKSFNKACNMTRTIETYLAFFPLLLKKKREKKEISEFSIIHGYNNNTTLMIYKPYS